MEIPIYQVDAFASRQFAGNPAAVCPLPQWLPAEVMQSIAAENNLAETAFLVAEGAPEQPPEKVKYGLRWFTPTIEVDLCGHATLAAAWVLWHYLGHAGDRVLFTSRSGELAVTRDAGRLCLDFPALPGKSCAPHPRLVEGLRAAPAEVLKATDYLAVFPSQEDVETLRPDLDLLAGVDARGVIVTAPGRDADFVSRFFAPGSGVAEDPVTGSAHCTLAPYWSSRLGRKQLHARQLSTRGGELWCEDRGARVLIAGYVAPYLRGVIEVG